MKKLLHTCLVFILPLFLYSQENKSTINFLDIEYSDLSKIILTDHYNDNFERAWGRVYEIEFSQDSISLFQTKEYYKPYQFNFSSLNLEKMFLLSELQIDSTEIERLISEVSKRNAKRSRLQRNIDSTYWGSTKMLQNWSEKRFVKNISKAEIEKLLNQINAKHNSPFKYLEVNKIDSTWLQKNSERLIAMLSNGNKQPKPYWIEFYKDLFTDYDNFKWKYAFSLMRGNMNSYPYFEMQLHTKSKDTICISSEGQNLYQIPWNLNGEYKTHNPLLPIGISNLLPEEECCSSKNRLNPTWSEVETNLIEWIELKNYKIDKKKWRKIAKQKQDEIIIDPIFPLCYRLKKNVKIQHLNLGGNYRGKILINADCDTINNVLTNHQIVFVKLKSDINPMDSIEIRLDEKFGNYKFIEENTTKILEHVSGLQIEKTGYKNCQIPRFTLPIRIRND